MKDKIICIHLSQDELDWLEQWLAFSASLTIERGADFAEKVKQKLAQAFVITPESNTEPV